MVAAMTVLGIVIFFFGLLFSFAWHELGHLATAKFFNIRCTQYMVGFGKTLWSRKWGETEYGVKLVPLGGYVRMVGMIPPARKDATSSTKPMSRWRAMIEDAREASFVELGPGDENRQFYQRRPWKRIIVMVAGPVMNLILAIVLLAVVMMGFGTLQPTTTVAVVSECVVPADADTDTCPEGAEPTPAAEAGVEPGDRIVAINGEPTPDWESVQAVIRDTIGPAAIEIERDGQTHTLQADLIRNDVVAYDENGQMIPRTDENGEPLLDEDGYQIPVTEPAGFLGVSPVEQRTPMTAGEAAVAMGDMAVEVGTHIVLLPAKIPGVWDAAFLGAERAEDSPVGVVGASRIGGEILTLDIPLVDRGVLMVSMLAMVNLFLFAFNMLPILPMDGGHIAGALWESIRRFWVTKVLRRDRDPGPFDVAQLMPVAYVMVALFLGLSVLLLIADIVNPVRLVQ